MGSHHAGDPPALVDRYTLYPEAPNEAAQLSDTCDSLAVADRLAGGWGTTGSDWDDRSATIWPMFTAAAEAPAPTPPVADAPAVPGPAGEATAPLPTHEPGAPSEPA